MKRVTKLRTNAGPNERQAGVAKVVAIARQGLLCSEMKTITCCADEEFKEEQKKLTYI
jgi:hypothetical protein